MDNTNQPPIQPTPQAPLDHSKTPNPQNPPQTPQSPTVPTSSQILPKHHNFPLHRALLIAVIILSILFISAYAGVYYLLNQQLTKITNARKNVAPAATKGTQLTSSPTPDSTPLAFPKGEITPTAAQQVACTLEAKQCSDGSYVSRTGPNCEFAACP
jgi:hypothetical protein